MKKRVVAWIFLSVVLIAVLSFGFFTTGETFKSSPPGELTRSITPTEIQCTDQDGDNVRIESYVLVGGGDLPSQIFDSCDVNGDINEQICVGNEPDSFTEPCSDGFACQRAACRGVPEWTQTGFLTAPDAGETDFFGISVAVSGDVMIVGAHNDDDLGSNSGSAYAFRNDGDQWVFEQKLLALDGEASDNFGYS
ncbi:MAG: FG-GAP repeat protein, partial [Nanoarchaeota archaeon]|nr:FG-GAP repeat protein [Nanoarchaeota archaeon]